MLRKDIKQQSQKISIAQKNLLDSIRSGEEIDWAAIMTLFEQFCDVIEPLFPPQMSQEDHQSLRMYYYSTFHCFDALQTVRSFNAGDSSSKVILSQVDLSKTLSMQNFGSMEIKDKSVFAQHLDSLFGLVTRPKCLLESLKELLNSTVYGPDKQEYIFQYSWDVLLEAIFRDMASTVRSAFVQIAVLWVEMEVATNFSVSYPFLRAYEVMNSQGPIKIDEPFWVLVRLEIALHVLGTTVENEFKSVAEENLFKIRMVVKQLTEFVNIHFSLFDCVFQLRGSVKQKTYEDGIVKAIKSGNTRRGIELFNGLSSCYYHMFMGQGLENEKLMMVQKRNLFNSFSNDAQKRTISTMKDMLRQIDAVVSNKLVDIGIEISGAQILNVDDYAKDIDLMGLKENLHLLSHGRNAKRTPDYIKNYTKLLNTAILKMKKCQSNLPNFKVVLENGSVDKYLDEFSQLKLLKRSLLDRSRDADNIPLNKN
jgi:hypothetical protein